MRVRNLFSSAAVFVLLCVVLSARVSPTGSFSLDQADPVAGTQISFTVDVQNLPTNGGATISPWIELACGNVYEAVEAAISPVVPNTSNPTRAYFVLTSPAWSDAGLSAQTCDAKLFYDGWNDYRPLDGRYPRPRKSNTLAALFFTVAAAPE